MKTKIFNGIKFAAKKQAAVKEKFEKLHFRPSLISLVHIEDETGLTYTKLKEEVADQVGVNFQKETISFLDDIEKVTTKIESVSNNNDISGLLIQKPSRAIWEKNYAGNLSFFDWWENLTNSINPKKDVDCLTRTNLKAVYEDHSDFLPATARASIEILIFALKKDSLNTDWGNLTISIVGKSELVGKPLAAKLSFWGAKTYLLGSKDNLMEFLPRSDIVISATGAHGLITEKIIKPGAVILDVGEPKPDVDFNSVSKISSFITPVPGGIGPVTVITLFENLLDICM